MATETSIVAHSSWHFEDLQLSSKEFYQAIEEKLAYYEYPQLCAYRTTLSESSFFTGREYLCVQFKENQFYICAAPFGRSFFISWWLKEQPNMWAIFLSYIPFFGRRWAEIVMRKTLYQQDSEDLFLQSIKKIVETLVEKVKVDKGFLNKD